MREMTAGKEPGLDVESLKQDVQRHYHLTLGRAPGVVSPDYLYRALALAIRDRLVAARRRTQGAGRRVSYLSMEFLIGRTLGNAVHALGIDGPVRDLLLEYGAGLEELETAEHDAGLGNGGLGRLAACFLDSCATMDLPVTGYGIRYEYGMFRQKIADGQQVEFPDNWLRDGNPWELQRAEDARRVRFKGRTDLRRNSDGSFSVHWLDTQDVLAEPYDLLIPGYRNGAVNVLRLWKAESTDEFNLEEFHAGSYTEAVEAKNVAENITMVLYPNDVSENGKALRLRQQYFLASATLQDVVAGFLATGADIREFGAANVLQLNDTHPSCAVPELMRILVDDHQLTWDEAWGITTSCMAYTNHTLLPEALERWSVGLFEELLPRLLEIVYEINARFLNEVASHWPGDVERLRRMSLIEEGEPRRVRMAFLAIVGSYSVNGVAALHSSLLQRELFADFYGLWPEKFNNKTNGVTPRRWLQHANAPLAGVISEAIGDGWQHDLDALEGLRAHMEDTTFQTAWREARAANRGRLAAMVRAGTGVEVDPGWLMDVQVKRIHEYKRQLLNILHVIHLYDRIHRGDGDDLLPRTVLFGGKAAPGYVRAREIIHLINCVAAAVNRDPVASRQLRVAFLPNYGVTAMELIAPGADLSEQISTAGKEASGTGNMKFMLNGALTIGTLDGANIEIRERAGAENFFVFGLTADEVMMARREPAPVDWVAADEDLARVLQLIESDHFSLFEPGGFAGLARDVRDPRDPWMVAADFTAYLAAQRKVDAAYRDSSRWQQMSIANTAGSGYFSSDRTIREYASDIWALDGNSESRVRRAG